MISRRTIVFGSACVAATSLVPGLAFARPASDRLLDDILIGISDAVVRNYIRDHYHEGRWDGRYWWHEGRRYTVDEYRHYLSNRARPAPPPPPRHKPASRHNPQPPRNNRPSGGPRHAGDPGGAPRGSAPKQPAGGKPAGGNAPKKPAGGKSAKGGNKPAGSAKESPKGGNPQGNPR